MNPLAVISGGTKGIGRATVELFLTNGFDVITCSRNAGDLEALQTQTLPLCKANQLHVHPCDLSEPEGIASFIARIEALQQPVTVLINNTGIFIPGQVHNEAPGVLEKTLATNLYSAYYLTKGLLGPMMTRQSGHIFMICSIASITAYPNGGAYSISKFALYGMTKVLREEMKSFGIKVTAVLPGATFTSSWAGSGLPPERFMKSEDVASVIWNAYQLSPGAVIEDLVLRPQLGDL